MAKAYGIVAVLIGGPYDGLETRLPDARWLYVPTRQGPRVVLLPAGEPEVSRWVSAFVEREVYEQASYRDRPLVDEQGRVHYRYRGRS